MPDGTHIAPKGPDFKKPDSFEVIPDGFEAAVGPTTIQDKLVFIKFHYGFYPSSLEELDRVIVMGGIEQKPEDKAVFYKYLAGILAEAQTKPSQSSDQLNDIYWEVCSYGTDAYSIAYSAGALLSGKDSNENVSEDDINNLTILTTESLMKHTTRQSVIADVIRRRQIDGIANSTDDNPELVIEPNFTYMKQIEGFLRSIGSRKTLVALLQDTRQQQKARKEYWKVKQDDITRYRQQRSLVARVTN